MKRLMTKRASRKLKRFFLFTKIWDFPPAGGMILGKISNRAHGKCRAPCSLVTVLLIRKVTHSRQRGTGAISGRSSAFAACHWRPAASSPTITSSFRARVRAVYSTPRTIRLGAEGMVANTTQRYSLPWALWTVWA